MNKYILFIAASCITLNAAAQTYDSTAWEYAKEIQAKSLEKHLKVLASDEFEGRETGKRGQKLAMAYLIDQFKSFGIEELEGHGYEQSYPLLEQENSGVCLLFGNDSLEYLKDFTLSPSFLNNDTLSGKLSFFDPEVKGTDGSNLLIWNEQEEDYLKVLKEQIEEAQQVEKLKSYFYFNPELEERLIKYEHYYHRNRTKLASDLEENETLRITLSSSGFEKLLNNAGIKQKKLDKKGREAIEDLALYFRLIINKPNHEIRGENVLAFIPGTDKKEEVIVITAHYDHLGKRDSLIFNGADDDGTGTASLIEIAQSFMLAKKAGKKPRRSILIMPVSGEEKGLLGSRYYTDNPIFPLSNTVANLNIDMIGRYDENHLEDSNYVYLIGADKLSQDLHDVSEKVNQLYTNFNLDYRFNEEDDPNRFYYRSDHYNFAKNNVPVIFYFSGVHEDYHKSTDTVEKIDFEKTEKIARYVFLTAWELANREERIQLNDPVK